MKGALTKLVLGAACAIMVVTLVPTGVIADYNCANEGECRRRYDAGRKILQSQVYKANKHFTFHKAYLDKQIWRLGGPDVADQADIDRLVEQTKKRIWNEVERRCRYVKYGERRVIAHLRMNDCFDRQCSTGSRGYKTLIDQRARSAKATIKWDGNACIDEIMDVYGGMM